MTPGGCRLPWLAPVAAGLALALLGACGGTGSGTPPLAACPPTCPGTAAPAPPPTDSLPADGSAAWDALVVAPQPGELARGGNDTDAGRTGESFSVVVPAGLRLRSRTVCQGRTSVTVTTDPPSGAESQLACHEAAPDEVIVQEQTVRSTATSYVVTVAAPAPVRWYAVLAAVPG